MADKTRKPLLISPPPLWLEKAGDVQARIALGRSGAGWPTRAAQSFLIDHARAREAVWSPLDHTALEAALRQEGIAVEWACSRAGDRAEYLRRPDLGRRLASDCLTALTQRTGEGDIALVIADGLSATAVERNAVPMVMALRALLPQFSISPGPVVVAKQTRVALGDEIGVALGARAVVVLIGEQPGLSAADSLGAYVTYAPRRSLPDSRRNCISNIREGGLPPSAAARQVAALLQAMMAQGTSGVTLIEPESPGWAGIP